MAAQLSATNGLSWRRLSWCNWRANISLPTPDSPLINTVAGVSATRCRACIAALNAALAPTNLPRTDLVTTFLTGITGVNKPVNTAPSEMLRLNTAVPPVPFANQNRLGVAGNALNADPNKVNDNAGFPNGRRPKDDVVDIALVAMVGGLCVINGDSNALGLDSVPGVPSLNSACRATSVPLRARAANIHDAVDQSVVPFRDTFPYLNTPNPGASNL